MQRIICQYRRDAALSALSQHDLRNIFLTAVEQAGLPIDEGRRALVMGPPLPPGATSDDERCAFNLLEPREPSDVRNILNAHLPSGLRISQAWIALPGCPDENPGQLDEAVYDLIWLQAPPAEDFVARTRHFLEETDVTFTRMREHKTQVLNARALVRDLHLVTYRDNSACIRITLSIGPQGNLRPDEVLTVLGYTPAPGALSIHRVALQQASWRHPDMPSCATRWRRR